MNNVMTFKAALAAGVFALASIVGTAAPVEARDGRNTAAVLGAVGGFAAGAAIASQPRYQAAPVYGTYHRPVRQQHVIIQQEPECRVKVTRSYNRYGELRTTRRTVCD